MRVAEKFVSINGEGTRAGELAVFLRFQGCNLNCSYCDTMWANEADCPYVEESPEELFRYVKDTGVRDVTLTGGEPLLQKEMPRLLELFTADPDLSVEIETNGAVDLKGFIEGGKRPVFTMDYKLPSSGCESAMKKENFSLLCGQDTVKFVCASEEDLDRALEIMEEYRLRDRCHVYLSPVWGKIEPAQMVEYMTIHKLNHVRLQVQIHKVIWDPERRGV